MVLMSASIAPTSAAVCVSLTIQYTTPSRTQERIKKRVAKSAAERKLSVLNTRVSCPINYSLAAPCLFVWRKESVSGAADGLDHIEFKALIDFTAQPADVAFDDAGLRIEMDAPHAFQQHAPRQHPIRVAHEVFQQ